MMKYSLRVGNSTWTGRTRLNDSSTHNHNTGEDTFIVMEYSYSKSLRTEAVGSVSQMASAMASEVEDWGELIIPLNTGSGVDSGGCIAVAAAQLPGRGEQP